MTFKPAIENIFFGIALFFLRYIPIGYGENIRISLKNSETACAELSLLAVPHCNWLPNVNLVVLGGAALFVAFGIFQIIREAIRRSRK